jgi:uncharacterized membrane protein YfcA
MVVVSISGTISHYREGNINEVAGATVGFFGMLGAVLGANIGQNIPEHLLQVMAGLALWFLAFLVWLRTRLAPRLAAEVEGTEPSPTPVMVARAGVLGVSGRSCLGVFRGGHGAIHSTGNVDGVPALTGANHWHDHAGADLHFPEWQHRAGSSR